MWWKGGRVCERAGAGGAALSLAAVLLCGRNAHTFGVTIPAHGSLSLDTRSAALRVAITAAADWAVSVTTTEVVGACARCAAAVPECGS